MGRGDAEIMARGFGRLFTRQRESVKGKADDPMTAT